jgi:PAS domain S-box-containing protein
LPEPAKSATSVEEAEIVETIARVGAALAAELDLEKIVQSATDAATQLSGAQFGAFFYNVVNSAGESYMLYTISGVPREHFSKFPMPRNTAVFAPTFAGEGTVRSDDITQDPRYGHNAPYYGKPKGHLPVRSYLATPVVSRSGEVIGGLFFGHSELGIFTERSERFVEIIASQAAVAIDNARLFEREKVARQQAQATLADLRKLQERFDLVIEASDLGVWYCDLPFDKLNWNAKVKEHFWLPPEAEVTIDLFYQRLHPDDRERAAKAVAEAIASRTEYDIDYRTVSESGEIKWIRAQGRAAYDANGQPIRFDGITSDITARKRAEELMIKSEKLAATGRMAATIAHEINNPLEAVTNLLFLARNHAELPRELSAWLALADSELARVSHITKQTLGFYREPTQAQWFNLAAALKQVLTLYEPKITRANLALSVEIDETVQVFGFPGEIKQVLANLIANAVDASRSGGKIAIRARSESGHIAGQLRDRGNGVRIVIADTGLGINPKDVQHIFEPFFTTKKEIGTGLGLWVSNGIVQKHRGRIRLRSKVNGGTVFSIFLPNDHSVGTQRANA